MTKMFFIAASNCLFSALKFSESLRSSTFIFCLATFLWWFLRPDGVIFLHKLKTVIPLELTVPIEVRIITAKYIKSKRYDSLIRECQSNGSKAILLTLEIGCRGYINNNVLRVLEQLGLSRAECRSTLKSCSQVALHCSYVIYLNRNKAIWHTMPYISRLEWFIGSL